MVSHSLVPCTPVDESITRRSPRRAAASYVGERFERLLIVEISGRNSHGGATVLCHCDCGREKVILLGNVTAGLTRSCGCLAGKGRNPAVVRRRPLRNVEGVRTIACADGRPHPSHTWRDPARNWQDATGRILCDGVPS